MVSGYLSLEMKCRKKDNPTALIKVGSGLLQFGGTFPRHFLKKSKQKVNNGTIQEREESKIGDVRKRNSK